MLHGRSRRLLVPALMLALLVPLSSRADKEAGKEEKKPAEKKPAEKQPTKLVKVAHIKLSGSLEEKAPTVDPLLGALGETFKDKLDRIRKAGDDKNIDALLLEIDNLGGGWGKLNELTQAIAAFRAKGKKAFAHMEEGNTKDYLVALACDEVCLPESAWLMLTGLRIEVSFYKDLLDKIGVKADMLHIGDYKSAAEPFTRDSLSEPNRKQLTSVLDDYFDHEIVARIVKSRKNLTAEKVKKLIDKGPFAARAARKSGLIDRLAYLDDYENDLKKVLGADGVRVVRDYGKKKEEDLDIFSLYKKLIWGNSSKNTGGKGPKVAVIYANGAITTGKSTPSLLGGESMGSDTIIKAIRDAEKNSSVKAIVLRVNSPGGSALASDLIWNELKRSKKPVVASMADVAASGGYYISMAAKKIYAEPGTLTGSIGVVGGKMATHGLWGKAGIKTEVISRGAHSGILTSDEPFSDSEKKSMKALMVDVYDQFVDKALQGRHKAGKKMKREELLALAGGRIWTGRQAKENGLIDELGTLHDAIKAAAKMGGLPEDKEPELLLLPKSKGLLDALFGSQLDVSAKVLQPALKKMPELAGKLQGVDGLLQLRREPVWAVLPFRIEVK
jgi:protease-4